MISDSDQRGFLLPFLAGALITSPLWFRPCCGGYPYPRPYGGGYYYYNYQNQYGGYPPYPPYGAAYGGGGYGYGVPPYGGAFRKSNDKDNLDRNGKSNSNARIYGGVGRFGRYGRFPYYRPFPFFRPFPYFRPFYPYYYPYNGIYINSPYFYYHGYPFYY